RRKWRRSKFSYLNLPDAVREYSVEELSYRPEALSGAADEVGDEVRVAHLFLGDLPVAFAHADAVDAPIHAGVRVGVLDHVCAPCLFAFPVLPGTIASLGLRRDRHSEALHRLIVEYAHSAA